MSVTAKPTNADDFMAAGFGYEGSASPQPPASDQGAKKPTPAPRSEDEPRIRRLSVWLPEDAYNVIKSEATAAHLSPARLIEQLARDAFPRRFK